MESITHPTDGRSFGYLFRKALKVGLCTLFLLPYAPAALAVGADSPIFGNPTPSTGGSSAVGKKSSQPGALSQASSDSLPLPEEIPQPLPGFFSTFFRLILALAVTLGLVYLTVWGLKVLWEKKGFAGPSEDGKPLKVLASVHLAPRKTVHLVEVGNRILVVGAGNEEVHALESITDAAEVEELKKACHQGFPQVFGRFMNRQDARDHAVEAHQIVSEGRQAVGDYMEKLKKASKSLRKKSQDDEDES